MSPSSRITIPPLSRPPSSSRSGGLLPAQLVWQRHVICGAALALVLSLGSALALVLQSGAIAASWQATILSIIFSMAIAGLLLGSVGALSCAFGLAIRSLRGHARWISALASALVALLYTVVRGGAEAFRFTSGSPLDLGTLEFVHASVGHLAWPILVEYAPLAALLALLATVLFLGSLYFLVQTKVAAVSAWRIAGRGCASTLLLIVLLHVFSTPEMVTRGGLDETADLCFLGSIAARRAEQHEMEVNAERRGVEIPQGELLSVGEIWTGAVQHIEGPRPNVLLVMMESVGTGHLGYLGYKRPVTPHLDRIAEKSVRFVQARATASHSNYAQMAVLSSLFPRRYSGLDTYTRLDYPRVIWHDLLNDLGYSTATRSSQDESWQGMLRFQTTATSTDFHHAATYEGKRIRMGSERIVPDQVTTTRSINWILEQKMKGPWGLYVNFQSTHFPYRVPPGAPTPFTPTRPTQGKFHYLHYPEVDRPIVINRYDNALAHVDHQIGRLYQALEASGQLDDTILVLTSDHGELFWDHGMVTHGRTLMEQEVRVPLLFHYPGRLVPSDVTHSVSTMDVLPTLAALLDVPGHPAFQGRSLLDEHDPYRPVFMNIQGMKSQEAVVCGRYKLINNKSAKSIALFDLEEDPGEENDVSGSRPQLSADLAQLLREQMRSQMRYHSPSDPVERQRRYAPRLGRCPETRPLLASESARASDVPY